MTVKRRRGIHPPQLVGRISPARAGEDPVVTVRRMTGELEAALQELQRFLKYLMDANDSAQVGAGIEGVADGGIDHGDLAGLADDDHPQYLKEKLSGGLASEIPLHDHHDTTAAGTVDHGTLTGLSDDDHTQYLTAARHGDLDGIRPRRPEPHVHTQAEIVDFSVSTPAADEDVVSPRTPRAHTHAYAEIVDPPAAAAPATVDEGSLILAAQFFGG